MSEIKMPLETAKVFSPKYWITTIIIVIGILFILSRITKQTLILRDNAGNQTGTGEVGFKLGWKKA